MKKFAKKLLSVSLSAVMLVTSTGTLALAEQGENVIQEDIKNEENSEELIEENSPEETLPEENVQEENFSEENIPPESPKEEETTILPENGETENSVILETPQEVPLEETPEVNAEGAYAIYQTHIEEIGWQGFRSKGEISGTVNEGKRLEAIEIKTNRPGLGIEYKTHIQDIGWETSMKKNGEQSGTTGQRKKIEAIRIVLTGAEKGKYDVYYQVQAQNFGWLDFAKNGEDAGTAGKNLRLEAIKIIIQEKGTPAPGGTDAPFLSGEPGSSINASYSTHVQDIGWQAPINNGEVSGTVGKAKQLEGIKIKIPNVKGLGVQYQSHIQNIGWQEWKADNEMSGTEKQGLQLEAIKIKLTGNTARFYDIYYKVHVENIGWMDWTKNGEVAGTQGRNFQLESIKIVVLLKGENPPILRHFGDNDFKCEDGCGGDVTEALKYKMDEVVDILGRPLIVTSGYRCKKQNTIDGGVWDSLHMSGEAVDAYTPGMSRAMVDKLAESGLKANLGVIRYYEDQFVHFQTYPRNQIMSVMADGVD